MLAIQKQTVGFPDKLLFRHEQLVVSKNKIVALLGRNGTGKSTFLKQIVKALKTQDSVVTNTGTFAYVPQLPENINPISGGEKVKLALNQAFKTKPNLLILDEPSANLDEDSQKWLIARLKEFKGIVLLVSHDEDLLNLADQTWVIENQKLINFPGNYATFCQAEERKKQKQATAYKQQQKQIKRLKAQIQRRQQQAYRIKKGNGRKLSNSDKKASGLTSHDHLEKKIQSGAKAIEKRLARMPKVEKVITNKAIKFVDPNQEQYLRKTVLHVTNLDVKVAQRLLISQVNLNLKYGQHLWLRGNNGSGKTTLVKTILQNREKFIPREINVGYFNQELRQIDLKQNVWDNAAKDSMQKKQVIYAVLGGLDLKQIHQKASGLSGGQLVRLQLAKVLLGNNQLLILDEPTNYLDLETKKSLQEFLQNYPGAILLISHNRSFAQAITDKNLMISNKKLLTQEERQQYDRADQGEILKLQMELDRLISDPSASLKEIKQLQARIAKS